MAVRLEEKSVGTFQLWLTTTYEYAGTPLDGLVVDTDVTGTSILFSIRGFYTRSEDGYGVRRQLGGEVSSNPLTLELEDGKTYALAIQNGTQVDRYDISVTEESVRITETDASFTFPTTETLVRMQEDYVIASCNMGNSGVAGCRTGESKDACDYYENRFTGRGVCYFEQCAAVGGGVSEMVITADLTKSVPEAAEVTVDDNDVRDEQNVEHWSCARFYEDLMNAGGTPVLFWGDGLPAVETRYFQWGGSVGDLERFVSGYADRVENDTINAWVITANEEKFEAR